MYIFLTILIVLAAILLILVVVIQNSKGGGLAAGFSSSNQIMGVRKTTDFLEKATWYLAAAVVVLSIISSHFLHGAQDPATETGINQKMLVKDAEKDAKSTANPFATPQGNGAENQEAPATGTPSAPKE
ncbi:preprotein translocase subunit SecG [Falsiporphyromonas endometrii]|uniref:Protein-export membrane protein SecG n=1 Tax=Falsiporphyromonas endometrii TaxID=1387297 RepID=A0ABV9K763_9PORP